MPSIDDLVLAMRRRIAGRIGMETRMAESHPDPAARERAKHRAEGLCIALSDIDFVSKNSEKTP